MRQKRWAPLYLTIIFICCCPTPSDGACSSSDEAGPSSSLSSLDQSISSNTGTQYMTTEYVSSCCGVLEGWTFRIQNSGTIYLQLWRPASGLYTLLAQKSVSFISSSGQQTVTLATSEQVNVESGDFVGWYTPSTDMVSYKSTGSANDNNVVDTSGVGVLSVGYMYTPNGAYTVNSRSYAIRADLGPETTSLTNLPASVTVAKTTSLGSTVFTVTASSTAVSYTASTSPSDLDIDSVTGAVTVTSSLSAGTYTVSVSATTNCSTVLTGTLTVTVTNIAPVLNGLPTSMSLSEDTTTETLLHTINATDADGDTITCSLNSVTPASGSTMFNVRYIAGSLDQGVYLVANAGLDYSTQSSYQLNVLCSDGTDSVTATLYVYLTQNNAPTVTNLQGTATVASNASINTVIFSVTANDTEGDQLSFSLSCNVSATCPFTIYPAGDILLTTSLYGSTTAGYTVFVYVSDSKSSTGPYILTVYVSDLQTTPQFTNLPHTATVLETATNTTTIFTLSVFDSDGDSSFTYTASFTPSSGAALFEITSAGEVRVASGQSLDYESVTSYSMEVTASDGYLTSSPGTLNISVANVNESPVFSKTEYSISNRENSKGQQLDNPGWQVSDPDGDTLTFTFLSGSGSSWFTLDSTSGLLSYALDYDVDGTSFPTSYVWTIGASDSGGLTATATLTLSITDYNDNSPSFSETNLVRYLYRYCDVGTSVLTATASDRDSGDNALLTYSLSQTSLNDDYFSVDDTGKVYTALSLLPYQDSPSLNLTLVATDHGSPPLSGSAAITLVLHDGGGSFLDYPGNMAWFTALIALLLVVVGLAVYFVATSGFHVSCREDSGLAMDNDVTQKTPQSPRRLRSRPMDSPSRKRENLARVVPQRVVTPTDVEVVAQWDPWNAKDFNSFLGN